jgi:hypothetical protein
MFAVNDCPPADRAEMDAGAVTGNPSRYITDPAPDGTPLSISP